MSVRRLLCYALVAGTALIMFGAAPDPHASYLLRLRLDAGDVITERAETIDRNDWVLPKERLEGFRRGGAVINEELRTDSIAHATVVSSHLGVARIEGSAHIVSFDVPRHQTSLHDEPIGESLTVQNIPLRDNGLVDVAVVGTMFLPLAGVHLGSTWSTTQVVSTRLGSGSLTIEHTLSAVRGNLVDIDVRGSGQITGAEYNLPKLLPGKIEIEGTATYDVAAGYATKETYRIHNSLLKPAGDGQIGFDEHETVNTSTLIQRP